MTDPVTKKLLPKGEPLNERDRSEFFELYKLIVESSEALVARRQQVNTFFLTINGVLVTAIGLFLRGVGNERPKSVAIAAILLVGAILCFAWRSLITSFGQLNTGKFAIIHRMEAWLAASVYAAEWEALGKGENPKIYRPFTSREIWVPNVLVWIYGIALSVAILVATEVISITDVPSKP